ncbi:MAG: hypothetical protein RR922_03415 [Clostridia bacterium]
MPIYIMVNVVFMIAGFILIFLFIKKNSKKRDIDKGKYYGSMITLVMQSIEQNKSGTYTYLLTDKKGNRFKYTCASKSAFLEETEYMVHLTKLDNLEALINAKEIIDITAVPLMDFRKIRNI